jgi:hypothetical protein
VAWWRGRKMGWYALVQWRCRLAERRHSKEGGAVESTVAELAQRSTVAVSRRSVVVLWWGEFFLKRLGASGWAHKGTAVGLARAGHHLERCGQTPYTKNYRKWYFGGFFNSIILSFGYI